MNGIVPVWASEIEPFPIRVTTKRFPHMKHYGDVNKISGFDIEPVDIISFGSPCTDLSVAGKRAGLEGEQSSLFFEAVRIIKEMRSKTSGKYPRFIVWENVPGAFSSGKGYDFLSVIEEICKIKDSKVSIPLPESQKWLPAGEIVGDGFSVTYRTFDAQYWGVPQRRRRIYLVADFAGECAGSILFESEGLSGYSAEGFRAWQGDSSGFESCAGISGAEKHPLASANEGGFPAVAFEPGAVARLGGHVWEERTGTLRAHMGDNQLAVSIEHYPQDSRLKLNEHGIVQTLCNRLGTGGNNVPMVLCCARKNENLPTPCFALQGNMIGRAEKNGPQGNGINHDLCFTLNATDRHAVAYDCRNHAASNVSATLQAKNSGGFSLNYINPVVCTDSYGVERHAVSYGIDRAAFNQGKNAQYKPQFTEESTTTLTSSGVSAVCSNYIVRKLTPSECARLQGFPPCWCAGLETNVPTDDEINRWQTIFETHRLATKQGKKPKTRKQVIKWLQSPHSDSAEYKMWGNGVALPNVCFVMAGIQWLANNS